MLLSKIPSYFKTRRDALMRAYGESAFVFPSPPHFLRNSDVHHAFRQESNFYYLSGFEEPESWLVLAPVPAQAGKYRTILFVLPRDLEKEMWEGERYGVDGAQTVFGADEAHPISDLDRKLPEILKGCDRIFYRVGLHAGLDARMMNALEACRRSEGRSGKPLLPLEDPQGPVGEMRLYKSPDEVQLMRKGCQISSLAYQAVMRDVRPGMNEFEVEAQVDYSFRKNGCQRLGYGSIVAGGKNATCLHYRSNNESLKDGDLLLIDAGGEYHYYSADITRTFPVNGRFTETQSRAYDLVLRAQKAGIGMVRPGATLQGIHKHVCEVMIEGLLDLGLLSGRPDELLKSGAYRRYYPHQTSHWLGMDVHDVGLYVKSGEPRPLEAGMVFTIEPGFYAQPNDLDTPSAYRGLGIRIEDDILVTPQGCEILTQDAPKERLEIEALRK